jgi:histidinol-phosphate aminotransferase
MLQSPFSPERRRWLRAGGLGAATVLVTHSTWAALPSPLAETGRGAAAGPALARLNLNESAFGPSPQALRAIELARSEVPRYVDATQAQALQRQIASLEGVAPEQVLLGEVLEPLGRQLAISGGGGEFVYSVPGYGALVDAAAPFGGVAVEVPLNADLENDLPALAARLGPRTRALFVVNPHNPSGTVSEAAAFAAFVRESAARTLVIVDEAYLDYVDDAAERSAVRLLRAGAQVLVFRTFGKLHGLAGLQIGYALAPAPLAAELRRQGVAEVHALNQLSVVAAAASLRDTRHLNSVRRQVARERALWLRWLAQRGLPHARAVASFVFFDSGRPHAEVAAALRERGILVARSFPPYATWVRITIGRPQDNLRARAALDTVLQG